MENGRLFKLEIGHSAELESVRSATVVSLGRSLRSPWFARRSVCGASNCRDRSDQEEDGESEKSRAAVRETTINFHIRVFWQNVLRRY